MNTVQRENAHLLLEKDEVLDDETKNIAVEEELGKS